MKRNHYLLHMYNIWNTYVVQFTCQKSYRVVYNIFYIFVSPRGGTTIWPNRGILSINFINISEWISFHVSSSLFSILDTFSEIFHPIRPRILRLDFLNIHISFDIFWNIHSDYIHKNISFVFKYYYKISTYNKIVQWNYSRKVYLCTIQLKISKCHMDGSIYVLVLQNYISILTFLLTGSIFLPSSTKIIHRWWNAFTMCRQWSEPREFLLSRWRKTQRNIKQRSLVNVTLEQDVIM